MARENIYLLLPFLYSSVSNCIQVKYRLGVLGSFRNEKSGSKKGKEFSDALCLCLFLSLSSLFYAWTTKLLLSFYDRNPRVLTYLSSL